MDKPEDAANVLHIRNHGVPNGECVKGGLHLGKPVYVTSQLRCMGRGVGELEHTGGCCSSTTHPPRSYGRDEAPPSVRFREAGSKLPMPIHADSRYLLQYIYIMLIYIDDVIH